jgi:predicted acyltransferase
MPGREVSMPAKTIDQGTERISSLPGVKVSASRGISDRRLVSLDVLRGIAVAGMILVTDPGTYSAVYPQLLHAQWNGATATDMIFPTFLFSVGVAITLSFRSRLMRGESRGQILRHVMGRSIVMFAVGLALNGFPDYDFHTIRIPGVLQRIALCYLCAGCVYLGLSGDDDEGENSRRTGRIGSLVFLILVGYWAVLKFVPVPGFGSNRLDSLGYLGAYIDRAVFGIRHLWPWGTTPGIGVTYDPEGILSTVPAIATTLIGVLTGEFLRTQRGLAAKARYLGTAGVVLLITGLLLNPIFPINKRIWTSTFVLVSSGVALAVFAVLLVVVDLKQWRGWTTPLLVFGSNAILAFTLSTVITVLTDRIHVGETGQTFHAWANLQLFATWLPSVCASLAYAIAIVMLNLVLLWPLYWKRIFVRI